MPPSYPADQGGPYLIEKLWLGGQPVETVVLDQIPSQANRIEGALLDARDQHRIELPLFELTAKTSRGDHPPDEPRLPAPLRRRVLARLARRGSALRQVPDRAASA
ncbi:MAG: hypothetical protein KatS3mg010_1658 [Acidimicrobiia bacterium]|nr:MAG: hypothetical protein KatS3mg010_1658 [Acidimicrobiia bacterium]